MFAREHNFVLSRSLRFEVGSGLIKGWISTELFSDLISEESETRLSFSLNEAQRWILLFTLLF